MATLDAPESSVQSLLSRPGFRQFLKFCIVGASSTVIDFGVYLLLMEVAHLPRVIGAVALARTLAQCVSFSLAVTNGFIWNSRWTFRHRGGGTAGTRYAKFVLTNVVGLALNLSILQLVAHLLPQSVIGWLPVHLNDPAGFIGKIVATVCVLFWNFTASKYWTFNG